ncbi:class I SAM-dependent methyltransferase [Salinispira pacifica]
MNDGGAGFDMLMAPLERLTLHPLRARLIREASGSVLEVGAGTGVNLRHYDGGAVESLDITDLDLYYGYILRRRRAHGPFPFPIYLTDADVQELPFEPASFDTVVFTLLFCSVEDPSAGLMEIRRVLKPDGRIIFIEHVLPRHRTISKTFRRLTPAWRRVAGNCHLDRATIPAIRRAGFELTVVESLSYGIFVGGVGRKGPDQL